MTSSLKDMKNLPATRPNLLIKYGDCFLLGDHRLICGDSRDETLVQILVGGDKIKLILADPPYGVSYVESKNSFNQKISLPREIANDGNWNERGYRDFTQAWVNAAKPHLEVKNSFYIFNGDQMIFALREGLKSEGFKLSQLLIWIKNQAVLGRKNYLPQHELIAFGWFGTHEFLKSKDKSVLIYPRPARSPLHPTMKPVGLLRRLILNSSRINDYVYDPFGGSGSTLIACEQTKRRCLMIELDPRYCETIMKRFKNLTGIEAKRKN